MRMPAFLFILLFGALPAAAYAVDIRERGESGVKFSADEQGGFAARTRNQSFTFLPAKDLLIQEQVEVVYQVGDAEESFSQISVDAWKINRDTLEKQHVWYINDTGERGEFSDDFYITHAKGCCTATVGSVYYSLKNGNRLATATTAPASIIVNAPSTLRRFVTVYVAGSSLDDEMMDGRENAVAAVSYFSPSRTLATLLLTAPAVSGERTAWLAQLAQGVEVKMIAAGQSEGARNIVLQSTGRKLQGVAVSLNFPGYGAIRIPLKDDRLDLEHATLPKGWLAEETPLMLQNSEDTPAATDNN